MSSNPGGSCACASRKGSDIRVALENELVGRFCDEDGAVGFIDKGIQVIALD
jgi:hypothetical protein